MKAAGTLLEKILARTAADLPARKKQRPLGILRALAKAAPRPPSFEQSIRRAPPVRLIAEIKRRNPQGFIDRDLDVTQTARDFATGGAAAISVVTEGATFGGSLEDLARARQGCKLPLLRRDFIIDEYQVAESRVNGASAISLVTAALDGKQLHELMRAAREVELEVLVEVHTAEELDRALDAGAAMVGLSHRDWNSLAIDLSVSDKLAPVARKAGSLVVAMDGIATREELARIADADAFLVGESLLRSADRAQAVRRMTAAEQAGAQPPIL